MAGGFTFLTPGEVTQAEQEARASQFIQGAGSMNPAIAGSLGNLGMELSGAFGRAIGGQGLPESPELQMARTRMKATKMIDPTNPDTYKAAASTLYQAGDLSGASTILSQMPKPSEKDLQGDYYQLTQTTPGGKQVQIGTKFVPKGQEIPRAGEGQSWFKIGTGTGGATTNISVGAEMDSFAKELGKEEAKKFSDSRAAAQTAVTSLQTIEKSKELIDKGIITGFGADAIVQMGKGLKQAGLIEGDSVSNTEAFLANQGKAVLAVLSSGAVGAGTGISDKDVEFMKQVAGGTVSLTEEGIKRIFDISEKAHRNVVDVHNRKAKEVDKRVKLPYSTQVQIPKFFDPAKAEMKAINDKNEVIYFVDGEWVDKDGYPYE